MEERYARWYQEHWGSPYRGMALRRAGFAFERDRLTEARRLFESVVAGTDRNGSTVGPALGQLARVLLAQGHPEEVVKLFERHQVQKLVGSVPLFLGEALSALAQAQLALGRIDDARATLARVKGVEEPRYFLRFFAWDQLEMARAALSRAEGHSAEAEQRLDALLRRIPEWRRALRNDVKLARGKLLLTHGKMQEGRMVLHTVAADAKAGGFLRVAREASEALASR